MSRRGLSARTKRWLIGGVVLLFVALSVSAPRLAAPVLRSRLQAMISEQLNAELQMDGLTYHPPYGITVRNARIVTPSPDGPTAPPVVLLQMRQLDLTLAKLPIGSGPLVIKNLVIHQPAVHLIQTAGGLVGRRTLVRQQSEESPGRHKLSEMFELRLVSIDDGQVVYEDRTRPGTVPLVWKDLRLDLHTAPQPGAGSNSLYGYQLVAHHVPIADLTAGGSMDIDDLVLNVQRCALSARVDHLAPRSPLPGQLQQLLREYQVDGEVSLDVHGTAPLREPAKAVFGGTLALSGARGRVPGYAAPLDPVALRVSFASRAGEGLRVDLNSFEVAAGPHAFQVDRGSFNLQPGGEWKVGELAAHLELGRVVQTTAATQPADPLKEIGPRGRFDLTLAASGRLDGEPSYQLSIQPRGVSFHPAEFPAPIENVAGAIRVTDGQVVVDGLAAKYGRDELKLPKLRVSLKDLPRSLRVDPIEAVVDFDSPRPAYPAGVADILQKIGPIGAYKLAGYVQVNLLPTKPGEPLLDYDLALTTEHGAVMPAVAQLPLFTPKVELHFTPGAIDVSTLEMPAFGGTVTATGHINLAGGPAETSSYKGRLRLRAVNLEDLAKACAAKGEKPMDLTGTAWGDVRLSGLLPDGKTPPLDSLRAIGDITIHNGHFFELPLFKSILDQLDLGEVVIVGDAAVVSFTIANRVVTITKGVISAPVLALEGTGTVGFDGALALTVIAANTGAKPYQDVAGSDIAGRIIGAIDNTLNAAGRHGLYEVRAGGTIQNPQIRAVPIPGLTTAGRDLIDRVRRASREVPAEVRDAAQARHTEVPATQKSGSP